jgi:hypothetical protein
MVPRWRLYLVAFFATCAFAASAWNFYQSPAKFEQLSSDKLIPVTNQRFINEVVEVDGKDFEHCTFAGVTLHIAGRHNFNLVDNTFNGPVRISYDLGPASAAASSVVNLLNQAGMIANGHVGFVQPNDGIIILRDGKP